MIVIIPDSSCCLLQIILTYTCKLPDTHPSPPAPSTGTQSPSPPAPSMYSTYSVSRLSTSLELKLISFSRASELPSWSLPNRHVFYVFIQFELIWWEKTIYKNTEFVELKIYWLATAGFAVKRKIYSNCVLLSGKLGDIQVRDTET